MMKAYHAAGMHQICASIIVLLCVMSCSQKPKIAPPDKPKPVYVGMVDKVFAEHKYLLVRSSGGFPETGATLLSYPPDKNDSSRVANLIVSPERMGNLVFPADIRSGAAAKGDMVFLYKNIADPDITPTLDDINRSRPDPTDTPTDTNSPTPATGNTPLLPDPV